MSGGSWVTYVSPGFAAVAAGIAGWQAVEAGRSARRAAGNERKAAAAAERAAAAGERAAIALEESNELRREENRKPRWVLGIVREDDVDIIRITNQGPMAYDVRAALVDIDAGMQRSNTFPAAELDEGLSGTLTLRKWWGVPEDRVLEISWRDTPDGEVRTDRTTT